MMKICIVSVYNSENCGSFLQAYALQKTLTNLGYDVSFFKRPTKGTSHSFTYFLKRILGAISRFEFEDIKLIAQSHFGYSKLIKQFEITKKSKHLNSKIDFFVIGSDTIWNFNDKYFKHKAKLYIGQYFEKNKFITYSASSGNTTSDDINRYNIDFSPLKNAKAIGVRDENTKQLVAELLGVSAPIVADPTLLLKKEDYYCFKKQIINRPYILLYHFGDIEKRIQEEIIKIAKDKNLAIVNIGRYADWCDLNVTTLPQEFVSYFADAEYIITNTFHGTVFSTIFQKNFAVTTDKKKKIVDYLNRTGLCKRMLTNPNQIIELYEQNIDYYEVMRKLDEFRLVSIEYLQKNLQI